MNTELLKSYKNDFEEGFKLIESCIDSHCSASEIRKNIEIVLGSRFDTFRLAFSKVMPFSLSRYIKRRILTETYKLYMREDTHIGRQSTYKGISRFIMKFEKEFNSIEVPFELEEKMDYEAISNLISYINGDNLVENANVEKGNLSFTFNEIKMFKNLASMPTFVLTTKDYYKYMVEMKLEEKFALLVKKTELEGIENAILKALLYEIEEPTITESIVIFAPRIFEDLRNACMNYIDANYPSIYIPDNVGRHLFESDPYIMGFCLYDTIEDTSMFLGISVAEYKEYIWQNIRKGIYRIK